VIIMNRLRSALEEITLDYLKAGGRKNDPAFAYKKRDGGPTEIEHYQNLAAADAADMKRLSKRSRKVKS